jgi:murein L,D-transpeptidase YcbB/YkuD
MIARARHENTFARRHERHAAPFVKIFACSLLLVAGISCRREKGGEAPPLAEAGGLFGPPAVDLDLPGWLGKNGGKPPAGITPRRSDEIAELHQKLYASRQQQPVWFEEGKLGDQSIALVEMLGTLDGEALVPADYGTQRLTALVRAVQEGDSTPGQPEELEAGLTWAALLAASDLHGGRARPADTGERWRIRRGDTDLLAAVTQGVTQGRIVEALRDLGPDHPGFVGLRDALRRYQQIAASGGWPTVPKGPVLTVGEAGDADRLRALARRLHAEGFLQQIPPAYAAPGAAPAASPGAAAAASSQPRAANAGQLPFTPELSEAVKRFQRTRTLKVDGNLGPETQEELNVPIGKRLEQLALNVERWRWVPDSFGDRAVVVNIPAYELAVQEGGHTVETMAVVVGEEGWETPVFADEIEYVEINPFWNVPPSILKDEVLPAVQRDPGYLAAHDMEVVEGQQDDSPRVSDSMVHAAAEGGNVRVRQRPGPKNPLGQIKFMFPNTHNIYLHDTPADHLFSEPDRVASHGCIRLERPLDLGARLLGGSWSVQRLQSEIASGERQTVSLDQKVPVYLTYFTAAVQPDGTLEMYEDVYGIDAAHATARAGRSG